MTGSPQAENPPSPNGFGVAGIKNASRQRRGRNDFSGTFQMLRPFRENGMQQQPQPATDGTRQYGETRLEL